MITSYLKRHFTCRIGSQSPLGESDRAAPGIAIREGKDTQWLDGLRGYAAFCVFLGHFGSVYWHSMPFVFATQLPKGTIVPLRLWVPYGDHVSDGKLIVDHNGQDNYHLLQLPILRLIYDGDAMVSLFFIISGYSLSIKPLTLLRQGNTLAVMPAISSAILRRPIRLLFPLIFNTFLIALFLSAGAFNPALDIQNGTYETFHEYFRGYHKGDKFPLQPTFFAQITHWFASLDTLLEFFTQKRYPNSVYDGHSWTIPVEFRCSLLLYLTQIASAFLDPKVRVAILIALVLGAFTWGDAFEMALFWLGMCLCEINLAYPVCKEKSLRFKGVHAWTRTSAKTLALFLGLYMASYPRFYPQHTPFYSMFATITIPGAGHEGQWRFWESVGMIITVATISYCLPAQRFLSNRLARFLGRISFSLYLLHGPFERCFSQAVSIALWQATGNDTWVKYNAVVLLTLMLTVPVLIASSYGFCILIDEPIVQLAKWLETRLKTIGEQGAEWEKLPVEDPEEGSITTAQDLLRENGTRRSSRPAEH